jgi:hypothetical protein
VATIAEMKNARSICTFVKRMNHLLRVPSLSSPVDSAQPTEPAGYSPPMPGEVSSYFYFSLGGVITDSKEEAVRSKSSEKASGAPARAIRSSAKCGEDDDNDGGPEILSDLVFIRSWS